jgi:hypothetical protein
MSIKLLSGMSGTGGSFGIGDIVTLSDAEEKAYIEKGLAEKCSSAEAKKAVKYEAPPEPVEPQKSPEAVADEESGG